MQVNPFEKALIREMSRQKATRLLFICHENTSSRQLKLATATPSCVAKSVAPPIEG